MTGSEGIDDLEVMILDVIRRIPQGDVMTYGEVAEIAGFPGRARAVGRVLAATVEDVPWWRVVGSGFRIVSPSATEQRDRLVAEGHRIRAYRIHSGNRLD